MPAAANAATVYAHSAQRSAGGSCSAAITNARHRATCALRDGEGIPPSTLLQKVHCAASLPPPCQAAPMPLWSLPNLRDGLQYRVGLRPCLPPSVRNTAARFMSIALVLVAATLCHGPRPPPHPEYTLRPLKKRKQIKEGDSSLEGSCCPPCMQPMIRPCLGHHVGGERVIACSQDPVFPCDQPCGNALECGNHSCTLSCHFVTTRRTMDSNAAKTNQEVAAAAVSLTFGQSDCGALADIGQPAAAIEMDACLPCELRCQKAREPSCPHACPLPCHRGPCPKCTTLVKRVCHCGTMTHVLECWELTSVSAAEKDELLSCRGPCHRKLPYCSHMCTETCHPGDCPSPRACRKKVVVRCACQRLKKEWLCSEVQLRAGGGSKSTVLSGGSAKAKARELAGLLPCNDECEQVKLSKQEVEEAATLLRQREAGEIKLEGAIMLQTAMPRRRKTRSPTTDGPTKVSQLTELVGSIRKWLIILLWILFVLLVAGLIFWGLQPLSRVMNAQDAQKLRQRRRGQTQSTY
eukprot:SM000154S01428  [mRNA]  locus=s154:231175:234765:- [translate_table: standard]